ncbi:MAG: hypothetical protein ACW9W4_03865 [Candidatus Nitrosopumilus sp. bin_7KS]
MNKNFIFFGILASILIGSSFGLFSIENSFAEEDIPINQENSKANQKQLDKQEKEIKKADERKQKLEDKQEKEIKKDDERKQKLDDKKAKLDSDRKKLEEKLSKKINKYEEKLKEIKLKYQNKIESSFTGDVEKFSDKTAKVEDKIAKKSDQIRKKLLEKQEKLDSRTQKILDKINNGDYLGDKISTLNLFETYELRFDSVTLSGIHNKTQSSTLEGFIIFNTFDKSKSNLKLELEKCDILVDGIPFNCGFGKARTTSSGDSGSKDSLVVLAFLEDAVVEKVYSTLKISLNADSPIGEITDSTQVSILNPQSKISGMWFLNGTGTLTKTVSTTDDTTDDTTENEFSVELAEDLDITGN